MREGNRSALQARRNKACILPRVLPKAQKAIQQGKKRQLLIPKKMNSFQKAVSNSFFYFSEKSSQRNH
jgi:hypothetical protein